VNAKSEIFQIIFEYNVDEIDNIICNKKYKGT